MYFHHSMIYPDGTNIQGKLNHQRHINWLGLNRMDIQGKSAIDIAANDAFFAFWSEWNGASRVIATDVDYYKDYDWGPAGPPQGIDDLKQQNKAEAFWFHHENTNSQIERKQLSIYDTSPENVGKIDFVFNFGLIYHLRHPRLAIERSAEICQELLFLETEVLPSYRRTMVTLDAGGRSGMLTKTDACIPSEAAIAHWMDFAGLPYVFIERGNPPKRQRFVACRSESWKQRLLANPGLFMADEKYWDEVRAANQKFHKGMHSILSELA